MAGGVGFGVSVNPGHVWDGVSERGVPLLAHNPWHQTSSNKYLYLIHRPWAGTDAYRTSLHAHPTTTDESFTHLPGEISHVPHRKMWP